MLLALCLVMNACTPRQNTDGKQTQTNSENEQATQSAGTFVPENMTQFTDRDVDAVYDEQTATQIILNGSDAEISGKGASFADGIVTVSAEGTYLLQGQFSGRIVISVADTEKVQLILNGAEITSNDYAALSITEADKVFLTLAEGSTNTLTDTENYALVSEDDNTDGCIFSKGDLTINGSGSLTVNGNYGSGIVTKDDLCITGGNLTVNSKKTALAGKDSVRIHDGKLSLSAGSNGIKSSNEEDPEKGYIYIAGGSIDISAETDGMDAVSSVYVAGGNIRITSGGGNANGEQKSAYEGFYWGASTASEDTASAKGVKSDGTIVIGGGEVYIDSADDSIHAAGDVTVENGTVTAVSGDDGIHSDNDLFIHGGEIDIQKSYEGLEAVNITVSGGKNRITASDDGMNAAGGADGSATQDRPGRNNFNMFEGGDYSITFTGGYTVIDASGDGVDSNGALNVSGGVILISGPTNSGNGALDYASEATITDGVFLAVGAAGMASSFSDSSTQCVNSCNSSSVVSGAYNLAITDANGNCILSFTPGKNYQNIVFSSPQMKVGESYSIIIGGSPVNANEDGFSDSGTVDGGTDCGSVSQTDTVSGNTGGGMPGGMPGGMGRP